MRVANTVQSPSWWDVIIIGSGPAGSAAAVAARWVNPSARVLLLDRHDFPRDKCCGDAVLDDGITELAQYGVSPARLLHGYQGTRSLRLITPAGRTVIGQLPTPLTVIPRMVFDARLLGAACGAGAVWRRHRVRSVVDRGSHVEVDGLRAHVVIGADGAESVVRRSIGTASPRRLAVALRGYTPVTSRAMSVPHMAFEPSGGLSYAWSFPASDGSANVGYGHLLRPGEHADRTALLDGLHRLLPQSLGEQSLGEQSLGEQSLGEQSLGERSRPEPSRVEPASLRAARLPLSTSRQPVADGRVLLAGDAAALVNPLSGEGIYYAINSGLAAGRAAAIAPARAAGTYRGWVQRRYGVHQAHAGVMAALTGSGRVLEAGLLAAGSSPALFADLAGLGLSTGRMTGRLALRLAWQVITMSRPSAAATAGP